MSTVTSNVLSGNILEEGASLTLVEICHNCHTPAETVIKLIEHGVISPTKGVTSSQWRFHQTALIRVDKALRLKQDLGVNIAGVALALELLDEIDQLKQQLKYLK